MVTDNITLVMRLVDEVWNKCRVDLAEELLATDVVVHDSLAVDVRGRESLKQFILKMHRGFPDLRLTVDDIMASGDEVCLRWTLTGTHTGPFFGLDRTTKHASVGGLMVILVEDGRIVESWATWNVLNLLQQLGYLPSIDAIARQADVCVPSACATQAAGGI
jgi:steroid delta-isomerase-like uncharacterized protein